jgi:photosystem II stability/assembly factor-like uncharacterized protein
MMIRRFAALVSFLALAGCGGPDGSGKAPPAGTGAPPPASPAPAGSLGCEEAPPVPERGWYPLQPGRPHWLVKVVPHPRDAQLIFAVALDRGLWRSDDGGQRFCPASTPERVSDVYPAADAGVVYARAGKVDVLLRSDDGGRSWQQRVWPQRGSRLIVDPANADILYLELAGESTTPLVRSLDGGVSWSTMGPPLPEPTAIWRLAKDPGNPDLFYAAGPCGREICLWRRSESAGSYELVNQEGRGPGVPVLDLVVDRASRLFRTAQLAGPPGNRPRRGLTRSLDGGTTFTLLPPLPEGRHVVSLTVDDAPPGHLYVLAVADAPDDAVVLESGDGGETWNTVGRGPLAGGPDGGYPRTTLAISNTPRRTFVVHAGSAVFRFEPGATAPEPILTDPGSAGRVDVAPSDPQILYVVEGARLYRSADGGTSWDLRPAPDFQPLAFTVDPTDANRLWGVFAQGYGNVRRRLLRSDDGGRSWQPMPDLPASPFPGPLLIPRRAPGTMYLASYGGVLVSTDRGSTWRLTPVEDGVQSLAISESDPKIGYLVQDDRGSVFVTRDGFATLTPTSPPPTEDEDATLVVDPHDPQVVYLLQEDLAYLTTNAGQTWAPAPAFPGAAARPRQLAFHPHSPGVLFSWTDTSIHISEDRGTTWRPANLGLPPDLVPTTLTFHPQSPATLWTALPTAGIWKTTTAGQ